MTDNFGTGGKAAGPLVAACYAGVEAEYKPVQHFVLSVNWTEDSAKKAADAPAEQMPVGYKVLVWGSSDQVDRPQLGPVAAVHWECVEDDTDLWLRMHEGSFVLAAVQAGLLLLLLQCVGELEQGILMLSGLVVGLVGPSQGKSKSLSLLPAAVGGLQLESSVQHVVVQLMQPGSAAHSEMCRQQLAGH